MEGWATFRLPCFSLFTSREGEIVRRSWTTWTTLRRDTGLRFTVKSIELISFTSVCSRAGRHAQLGKVAQLTHRCHLHAHLKSQPPCIVRSCGNQLSSSSALKGVPGIPVWWEALHYPWLFRHFTWKTIWVLHLWIDLAYEELFARKLWSWHRTSMPVGASECFSAHL